MYIFITSKPYVLILIFYYQIDFIYCLNKTENKQLNLVYSHTVYEHAQSEEIYI